MTNDQLDAGVQHCEHREHQGEQVAAVAVYEGTTPPAGTIRYAACAEHAPDAPPIRYLDERLVTDGARDAGVKR